MPTVLEKCPRCGAGVSPHCPDTNTTCTWEKCRRELCGAILCPTRYRGFLIVKNDTVPVRWVP